MAGETPEDDTPPKPDEFFAKSKWQRFQIYIAGPAMNVLAAFLIMIGVYLYGASEPSYQRNPAEVGRVVEGSSAAKAGIQVGDRLTRIAGYDTPTGPTTRRRCCSPPAAKSRSSSSARAPCGRSTSRPT